MNEHRLSYVYRKYWNIDVRYIFDTILLARKIVCNYHHNIHIIIELTHACTIWSCSYQHVSITESPKSLEQSRRIRLECYILVVDKKTSHSNHTLGTLRHSQESFDRKWNRLKRFSQRGHRTTIVQYTWLTKF